MGYFTYLAAQAFRTSETGERLFYRGGPWSRPYIIPDAATEQRIYGKHLLMLRVLLSALIIGQPLLFILHPDLFHETCWFLIYLVVVTVLAWLVWRAVLAPDLRNLQQAQTRLPLRLFYGQMAKRHSAGTLILGFMASCLFVAGPVWMLARGAHYSAGILILCMAFFSLCTVAWGYALYLKLKSAKSTGL